MTKFDQSCTQCPRLVSALAEHREKYPTYHLLPVAPFGDAIEKSYLTIVGLAPGFHGANRTGRPFTGDFAGEVLYKSLHRFGFCSHPSPLLENNEAQPDLKLTNCRITNAVKCWPPKNKPTGEEVKTCNQYLKKELAELPKPGVILCLGALSHNAVLKTLGLKQSSYKFGHDVWHTLDDGLMLVDSYHTSRYNIQTKRLTQNMFDEVISKVREYLCQRYEPQRLRAIESSDQPDDVNDHSDEPAQGALQFSAEKRSAPSARSR